jgi:hypothetical protein
MLCVVAPVDQWYEAKPFVAVNTVGVFGQTGDAGPEIAIEGLALTTTFTCADVPEHVPSVALTL